MEFIKAHQLNAMLFMSGICGILTVLTLVTRSLSFRRRRILALLEVAAMLLLLSDRLAYIYRGDASPTGYWMVRVCNFLVYFFTLFMSHSLTLYLYDLYRNEGKLEILPKRLKVCEALYAVGLALLILSQFTGLYYTFDAQNSYQRASLNLLSYAVPFAIVILQQSVVLQYRHTLSPTITLSLVLNTVVPVVASIIQVFAYGISLINMSSVGMAIVLYLFALIDLNNVAAQAKRREIDFYREEQQREHALFEQTAEALASAIDAKDKYTHGHSTRVALYSRQIAEEAGKSEEECEKVYFAALLHDVGKIGIPDAIINKDGKLTNEEFAQIKLHPVFGNQILSSIQQSPYLSIGAHYHHERYDGRGYPEGLKGDDIPEIARIIAVADSYDAMTSKRSYRDPIPQQKVREELVKGMGTQFDPVYAKLMLHLIDLDLEYQMREAGSEAGFKNRIHCETLYRDCSMGILLGNCATRIELLCWPDEGYAEPESMPTLILFDALDARVHQDEYKQKDLLYLEYARLRFDGPAVCEAARRLISNFQPQETGEKSDGRYTRYTVEAVRHRDHARIIISGNGRRYEHIIALPDSTRFAYISLAGEHCVISNIHMEVDAEPIAPDAIPRIADEISYIAGCPEGDIPNVQIDGWCTQATRGIPLVKDLALRFHTQSLPTARLVWHCPYVTLFTSQDGQVRGPEHREYTLIRFDGENWESNEYAENRVRIDKTLNFEGWNVWKEKNKEGLDCRVVVRREGNVVTITTENLGITILSATTILDGASDLYVALTGDQVALTDIHVEAF